MKKLLLTTALLAGCGGVPQTSPIGPKCDAWYPYEDLDTSRWAIRYMSPQTTWKPTGACPGRIDGYEVNVAPGDTWWVEHEFPGFIGDTARITAKVRANDNGLRFVDIGGQRVTTNGNIAQTERKLTSKWTTYQIGGTGTFWIGDATFYFGP